MAVIRLRDSHARQACLTFPLNDLGPKMSLASLSLSFLISTTSRTILSPSDAGVSTGYSRKSAQSAKHV